MFGKIIIQCDLLVCTGLHIGGSDAFSAIGAIDSPVVRDTRTHWPIVPGSSLKGKLRTLLAMSQTEDICKMNPCEKDGEVLCRLFGSAKPVQPARLQFADSFVSNGEEMRSVGLTEAKYENTINRLTSVANPRQIERVTSGTRFRVNITYNLVNENELDEDMNTLIKGFKLLQLDYLGGHGSRGSGRVKFENFDLKIMPEDALDLDEYKSRFKEVENYAVFSL